MYEINQENVMRKVKQFIENKKGIELSLAEYMSLNEQNRQLIYNYLAKRENVK